MAITPGNQPPIRNPSGATTDPPYGPLADSGMGNPFFYHQFQDDFDNLLGPAGAYTLSGTGTVAHTAGDGGLALFSTTAIASALEVAQLPAASFTLPGTGNNPPATSASMKKMFYMIRLQLSDVTLSSFIAGLCNTGATFTAGAATVTDGLYFTKAASSTVLQLVNVASAGQSPSGSGFTNTFTMPAASYTLTNATNIDLAFAIDRSQNLFAYVGSQLVGWLPQSGTGTTFGSGVSVLPVKGKVFANYNFQAQGGQAVTPIMFTQANLNVTIGVSNGVTAAVKTLTADFHCCQKER